MELLKVVHKKEGGIEGLELLVSTTGTKDVETEVSTESKKEEDENTVTNKKVIKKKNAIMVPVRALFYSLYTIEICPVYSPHVVCCCMCSLCTLKQYYILFLLTTNNSLLEKIRSWRWFRCVLQDCQLMR